MCELQDEHYYQHLTVAAPPLPPGGNGENRDPKLQPAHLRAVTEQMAANQKLKVKTPLRPQKSLEEYYQNLPQANAGFDEQMYENVRL